ATFGSFAYSQNFIYVQCNGHGVVGLKFNGAGPSFTQCGSSCPSPDWQAGGTLTFGPPIVAHGAVWVIDINGSGLYAYRATDGALLYHSSGFSTVHFATPAEAGGQVFVPANQNLRQFVMGFPPATSIAGPIPPRPNPPAQQPGGTASGRPTIGQASPQP